MALRTGRAEATALVVAAGASWLACGGVPRPEPQAPGVEANLLRLREDALARAKVWHQPDKAIGAVDFGSDPAPPVPGSDPVECAYELKVTSGRTPKFHCVLPGGRVLKVKYGRANVEPRAELAATRLLSALGFGADRMHWVKRVRCNGCPIYPHPRWRLLNRLFARDSGYVDFHDVVVEDAMPGRTIEAGEKQGWTFFELDKVDPARGGATRAEVDALRLMAVFLADWDNKAVNQRVVCLPGGDLPDGGCSAPFAYIQDVGATFGPKGLDLEAWRATPIWADAGTCRVSMKSLPFGGATFRDTNISESGRALLAGELNQLRPEQVRDLFTAAGFTEYMKSSEAGRNVENWVAAFDEKVRQIADRPPCPDK